MTKVGVLALQGDVGEHTAVLRSLGAASIEVRAPQDLRDVDALVLPGGESTTMSLLLGSSGLFDPITERLRAGMPAFGTCAGLIMLASEILDGRSDQRAFAALDISVRRNAFGRQIDSFETDLVVEGLDGQFHAVFIRAPVVTSAAPEVEVLASLAENRPVLCRKGSVMAAAFHPELAGDPRIHEMFLRGA